MKIAIAIPARYNSTRLPGKSLIKLGDKTVIEHCYDCTVKSGYDTFVLTDNQEIASVIGPAAHIVPGELNNGTERVAAAEELGLFKGYTHVINVQGDQPLVDVNWIHDTVSMLREGHQVTHLYTDLQEDDIEDTSVVKLIQSQNKLMWMSRNFKYGYRGVFVYGFTRLFLQTHNKLTMPLEEQVERVEQLRWLKHGYKVAVKYVTMPDGFVDINLQKDVDKWHTIHQIE